MAKNKDTQKDMPIEAPARFKITKTKVEEMYKDDQSIKNNVDRASNSSVNLNTATVDTLKSAYYRAGYELADPRNYAEQAYDYLPIFSGIIDYLSNMYCWRYTYVPRIVKDRANLADYAEIYDLMGEVVDGICVETTFPNILAELFIFGAVYLISVKHTSSKTITTLLLPYKYCRPSAITQLGTIVYQFNYEYFDSLGLAGEELEKIFEYYPAEMHEQYNLYKRDAKLKWQMLDPKFAGAIMLNKKGFPNKLYSLFGILQYQIYTTNELERNSQLLDKIVSHQIPVWQDNLIIDIDEMAALHASMAKVIAKNSHIRLLSTYGDVKVHSIGEDTSKENKTLENAYNTIYDTNGLNHAIFNSESVEALRIALSRDKSYVWKFVEQIVAYFNVVINNSYNFKGYQCDFSILPITKYDEKDKLELYKEGATLGVTKLEYIVATGIKQVDIKSKFSLEDYLKLDSLKPLSTSYTQSGDNQTPTSSDDSSDEDTSNDDNEQTSSNETDEVVTDEQDTN